MDISIYANKEWAMSPSLLPRMMEIVVGQLDLVNYQSHNPLQTPKIHESQEENLSVLELQL